MSILKMSDRSQRSEGKAAVPMGNVDGLFGHIIVGWFHSGEEKPTSLDVRVNNRYFTSISVEDKRPDVVAVLGFGETSGFKVFMNDLNIPADARVSFYHTPSGFDFNGFETRYSPDVSNNISAISDVFIPEYYRCHYASEFVKKEAAFQRYLLHGIYNDHNPCPWFDCKYFRRHHMQDESLSTPALISYMLRELDTSINPSTSFSNRFYAEQNTDLDPSCGLLRHFVQFGRFEGRIGKKHILPVSVRDEFEALVHIEPALSAAKKGLDEIVRYPFPTSSLYLRGIMRKRLENIRIVVCVPYISHGGADLISTFVLRAYQERYGKNAVLLLVTDRPSIDTPSWIAPGSEVVCLDDECTFPDMRTKVEALHVLLGSLPIEKIVNVNSNAAWNLYRQYGMQLSSTVDLYAYLFCFDYNEDGHRVGYITEFLCSTLRYLRGVFFDNRQIVEDINKIYGFSKAQRTNLHAVYVPKPDELPKHVYNEIADRGAVLWVGRLARQKRVDVLLDIAAAMPGQKFVVYGPVGDSPWSDDISKNRTPNIEYRGLYHSLTELEFNQYKLYLNTSEWEGLPTIIIQMMAIGLPVVTSRVGGIGELIDADTGWLVEDCEDVESYVQLIKSFDFSVDEAQRRVDNARKIIEERHTWKAFINSLAAADAFCEFEDGQMKRPRSVRM